MKEKRYIDMNIKDANLIIRDNESQFAFDQSNLLYKELEKQEKLLKELEASNSAENKLNLTRDRINKLNLNRQDSNIQIDNFSSVSFKTGLAGASFSSNFTSTSKITTDNVIYQKYV